MKSRRVCFLQSAFAVNNEVIDMLLVDKGDNSAPRFGSLLVRDKDLTKNSGNRDVFLSQDKACDIS